MSYRFDLRDGSLSDALHRIAQSQIAPIRTTLADTPDPAGIHDIRKRVKKLRALLRLMRSGLPRVQPAETVLLRDAARLLAAQRDAVVRLATLDRLIEPEDGPQMLALRAHLAVEAETLPQAPPADPDRLRNLFDGLVLRVESWSVQGSDRRVLVEGLATTREKARRQLRLARDNGTAEALHDLRKRVKDLWYQARLFAPVWPAMMKPIADEAGRLGETLGLHHDLAELALHLDALPDDVAVPSLRESLAARITDAQAGIEAAAFPLGARLLAGDPEEMAELWVKWWRLWRAQLD
ncbi:CHAD domain-containing protein [Gemmobacter serpentinus]|uniref:CHAD domain-containing protein n=1 Tax=Gemmobacter serpentinus TaxID=2652247 RepID=UPI00124CA824|nr:CHAD domain-containing protein [Gemmobacter serpentinus]